MMKMVEAAGFPPVIDGLRQPDEDNPNGYYELEAVKKTKQDPSWVARAPGKAVKVIHLLLNDLPPGYHYRVLFMRRAMPEILASQRKMLERHGKAPTLSDEVLARTYELQLKQVDAALKARPEFTRIDVDYNAMMKSPAEVAATVAAFIDRPDRVRDMAAVVDPNLYRNRKA